MKTDDQIVVFRTGSIIECDSVTCALKDAGVPYFTREETSGGLYLAMPAAPSVCPGTWWSVVVPQPAVENARAIIAQFPFGNKTNPDVWDFQPKKSVKLGWKIYVAGGLLLVIINAIWQVIKTFR
ncbi:MAG: DUF2007 domain-containing protein [Magnetococcus sp. WYHC-3]